MQGITSMLAVGVGSPRVQIIRNNVVYRSEGGSGPMFLYYNSEG